MPADRNVPCLKGENKAVVTDLNLSEALPLKALRAAKQENLWQSLTGMLAVHGGEMSSCQDHLFHTLLLRQLA